MQALGELAALLRQDREWEDEETVLDAVVTELDRARPPFLAAATGQWNEPYLTLEFRHEDGTVFTITHGDGYTSFVGGTVDFRNYLDTASLTDVLIGALRGRTTYVRRTRLRYKVDDYFEVVARPSERLGSGRGIAGAWPLLLKSMPLLPESLSRTRLSFQATPAIAAI